MSQQDRADPLVTRLQANSKTFGEMFKDALLLREAIAELESRDQRISQLEAAEKVSQAEIVGLKRELANALDLLMAGRPDLPTSKRAEPQ